jgi:iron complex outermembrane receptor protein
MKFKKLLILFIVLTGVTQYTQAQCSLKGTITDHTDNSPVAGAIVFIPDLNKGTATDNDGKYLLENLPKGKYLLEVKQIGYATLSSTVSACEKPIQDFSLSPSVIETKEVVVTGASKATELLKMPGAVTTIDHTVLFKTTSTNIIDALTCKPGISQITTGAGISKPVIRGLGYNRIITLNDGIRQEGQQWGDEHGIEIDEFSANKIEILKGPASLMYGSDAMAGVINILSTPAVAEGRIGGSIAANYQTNNGLAGISAMQNGNLKGISWMLRGSYKNAGSYSNKYDGKVFNSGYNESDFSGNLGLNKKWGYSHLIFSSFSQNLGLIDGTRDSVTGKFLKPIALNATIAGTEIATDADLNSRKLFVPRQAIVHNKIALDNMFILGKSRLSLLLAYQHNSRKEYGDILAPQTEGLYFSLKSYTYDVKYFLPEKNNWQLTLGSNGMIQQNKNLGKEFLIPQYQQMDAGVFAYAKKEITAKLNIAGGVRYDMRNYQNEELKEDSSIRFAHTNKNFSNISGSIGTTYALNKRFVVKANVARGYRAPQAAEISSNGLHEGTFRYEIGNGNLKAETSLQGDLGVLFNSDHVSVDAALFSNNISNFIYLKKLSSVNGGDSITDPTNPTPTYKFVQGNASLNGAEISIDIHPHPLDWLHFENTFSYVNAVNKNQTDSSKYLPFTPATRITSELRADIKKLKNTRFVNSYILLNAQVYLKQSNVLLENGTETPTPGYTLFNAAIGSDVKNKKGKTVCSIILAMNNITDIAYQSHLSRLKYAPENYATGRTGVYNMGRNLSVKVQVPLSFK